MDRILCEREMMGRYLCPDLGPKLLSQTDHFHGMTGTDMLDVHGGPGIQGNHTVPGNQGVLCQRRGTIDSQLVRYLSMVDSIFLNKCLVLLMKAEHGIQPRGFFHGGAHKSPVHQRYTVIREPGCTGCQQSFHIRQFLPLKAHGNRGAAEYVDSGFLPLLKHVRQGLLIVNNGLCVGHADHCGKTAFCSCFCPCADVLLIGKPRVPEMYMDVHQTRRHNHALGIYDLRIGAAACNCAVRISAVRIRTVHISAVRPHIICARAIRPVLSPISCVSYTPVFSLSCSWDDFGNPASIQHHIRLYVQSFSRPDNAPVPNQYHDLIPFYTIKHSPVLCISRILS